MGIECCNQPRNYGGDNNYSGVVNISNNQNQKDSENQSGGGRFIVKDEKKKTEEKKQENLRPVIKISDDEKKHIKKIKVFFEKIKK